MASLDELLTFPSNMTVYYDTDESSDGTMHTGDLTVNGVEEHEVEDILSMLAASNKTPENISSMAASRPSPIATQILSPATPAPSKICAASSQLPECEDSSEVVDVTPSSPMSQETAPTTPTSYKPQAVLPSSLFSRFPDIELRHITSVITHELHAEDLYKLDTRHATLHVSNADYDSFDSLYFPLLTYFSILSIHLAEECISSAVFFDFLAHLQEISSEYEWSAVRMYTIEFFNRRRVEMLESSDYTGWSLCDTQLAEMHLFSSKKFHVEDCGLTSPSTVVPGSAEAPEDLQSPILPSPTMDDTEPSQAMSLLIGYICSLVGLTIATLIALTLILIPFSVKSVAIPDATPELERKNVQKDISSNEI